MSEFEPVPTGEVVTLGRRDYGWGREYAVVTIGGDVFAEIPRKSGPAVYAAPCGMCSPFWSGSKTYYLHRHGGVCYQCGGTGRSGKLRTAAEVVKLVKRRASDARRAERKRAEAEAAAAAEHDAWVAKYPAAAEKLAAIAAETQTGTDPSSEADMARLRERLDAWGSFVTDLAARSVYGSLTEKQTVAVMEAVAEAEGRMEFEAEKAAAQRYYGAEGEKFTATGTVIVAVTVDGYHGASRLVVVEGEGEHAGVTFKALGTAQSMWETERGQRVEVAATVKNHEVYEGTKQTVVTRTKIKVLEEAAS